LGLGRYYSKYEDDGGSEQTFLSLQLGVVGPWSLAQESQKWVHDMTGSRIPAGWDNQIDNEIGLNLLFQQKNRFPIWREHLDFTSHIGGSLGNVFTFANAGGSFRLGPNLPQRFHINKMEPVPRVLDRGTIERLRLDQSYIYLDFDGRVVLQNIFLDGNTFSDSHSVDKEYLVGDIEVGFSVSVYKLDVMMGYIFRSKEFKEQEKSNKFAAVRLIYNF